MSDLERLQDSLTMDAPLPLQPIQTDVTAFTALNMPENDLDEDHDHDSGASSGSASRPSSPP